MKNNTVVDLDINEKTFTTKVPIFNRSVPYIYIKMNDIDSKYRVSSNYKYLNEQYNLKINFIRDLDKISNKNNEFFILDSSNIKPVGDFELIKCEINDTNYTNIYKTIITEKVYNKTETTTLMIIERVYREDINYSVFFTSTLYYSLDEFIG